MSSAAAPTETGTLAGTRPPLPAPSVDEIAHAFPQLQIIGLIGQGGMGFVYRARQPKLERDVALKILPQHLAAHPGFAERFAREGKVLAKLNHPNIVSIFDFGESGGYFYLLMEFVDGVNLRQAMRASRFTAAQALSIVPRICEALQFAHEEGVLHRDIKPENILMDAKGRVKIADFGIAKLMERGSASRSTTSTEAGSITASARSADDAAAGHRPAVRELTAVSSMLGTPQYMAPEQIEHPSDVDHRADIYSLGVVFYELLTGELPIGKFAPPSAKTPLSERVDEIVMRALAKQRELRQQSAGELKTQVETAAAQPAQATAQTRLLGMGNCYVTTPEKLATFSGQFFHFRNHGQLMLEPQQIIISRGAMVTTIPFAAIRDLSIGRYPVMVNPVGLDFISIRYEERGQIRTIIFTPHEGLFGSPFSFNQYVTEWFETIQQAVLAVTGQTPGRTPADQLGTPRSAPGGLVLLGVAVMLPALLGILIFATARNGMAGRYWPMPLGLTIAVLAIGLLLLLGLRSLRRKVDPKHVANVSGPAPNPWPHRLFWLIVGPIALLITAVIAGFLAPALQLSLGNSAGLIAGIVPILTGALLAWLFLSTRPSGAPPTASWNPWPRRLFWLVVLVVIVPALAITIGLLVPSFFYMRERAVQATMEQAHAVAAAAHFEAEGNPFRIVVHVESPTGDPVPDAQITVARLAEPFVVISALTDGQGRANVALHGGFKPKQGMAIEVSVQIAKDGYVETNPQRSGLRYLVAATRPQTADDWTKQLYIIPREPLTIRVVLARVGP